MRTNQLTFAAAGALLLAGCATTGSGNLPYMGGPDNFGEANKQTFAAMVVNPDPVYDVSVPETHAEHAGQAVERYRTDKVKVPDRVRTNKAALPEASREPN